MIHQFQLMFPTGVYLTHPLRHHFQRRSSPLVQQRQSYLLFSSKSILINTRYVVKWPARWRLWLWLWPWHDTHSVRHHLILSATHSICSPTVLLLQPSAEYTRRNLLWSAFTNCPPTVYRILLEEIANAFDFWNTVAPQPPHTEPAPPPEEIYDGEPFDFDIIEIKHVDQRNVRLFGGAKKKKKEEREYRYKKLEFNIVTGLGMCTSMYLARCPSKTEPPRWNRVQTCPLHRGVEFKIDNLYSHIENRVCGWVGGRWNMVGIKCSLSSQTRGHT